MTDTSDDAVEKLIAFHALSSESGAADTADMLLALLQERDRLREALRRIGTGNSCTMAASNPPICSRALAARAALKEDAP